MSPHTRSLITAYKVCWHSKENLKGNVKADTENSSQAGRDHKEPKRVQTRTVTGRVVALLVVAEHWQSSDSSDRYTACITLEQEQPVQHKGQRDEEPKEQVGKLIFPAAFGGSECMRRREQMNLFSVHLADSVPFHLVSHTFSLNSFLNLYC